MGPFLKFPIFWKTVLLGLKDTLSRFLKYFLSKIPFKINHPVHNIYVMNEFLTACILYIKMFSEKTLIKVCSLYLYASFGTFCTQIGQLFESQWVFEVCLKIDKLLPLLLSKENVVDFGILPNVYRLAVPRIMYQFGRKRCQKKRKDVDYKLL